MTDVRRIWMLLVSGDNVKHADSSGYDDIAERQYV
jgi:hypothetical protein